MRCNLFSTYAKRVIALTVFVGALPFLFSTRTHATETAASTATPNPWLDDYKAPVGFTYNAQARLQTTYIWRGLYAGGFNLQTSANVGYGGLYFDMWWNIGTVDWSFSTFQPEVDLSLGFSRWGLDVFVLYVHNFQRGFFDLNYHDSGRNALELDVRYTVSSKLPLSIVWATRFTNADAYINAAGDTVRAYSSYLELSYTHHFPFDISLYGAFGITPWRSLYTGYQRGFAVQNIDLRLRKDWSVHERIGLMLQGQLTINPSALAADKATAEWHPLSPGYQAINANIALGIYLK